MTVSVHWCLRKIKLVEPSHIVAKDYVAKARTALGVAEASIQNKAFDWTVIAAYYARYDAAYALLMRVGIKSEIHECTIALLKTVFVRQGLITSGLCDDLEQAKEARIDAQYYVKAPIIENEAKRTLVQARAFVLAIEAVLERFTDEMVGLLRKELEAALK